MDKKDVWTGAKIRKMFNTAYTRGVLDARRNRVRKDWLIEKIEDVKFAAGKKIVEIVRVGKI